MLAKSIRILQKVTNFLAFMFLLLFFYETQNTSLFPAGELNGQVFITLLLLCFVDFFILESIAYKKILVAISIIWSALWAYWYAVQMPVITLISLGAIKDGLEFLPLITMAAIFMNVVSLIIYLLPAKKMETKTE